MAEHGDTRNAAAETEELFSQVRGALMRYLRHHLDDASAAEDIAQEGFIRFYQARSQGEVITQPKAWLFRVAHNLLIDYGRKKRPDLLILDLMLPQNRKVRAVPIINGHRISQNP